MRGGFVGHDVLVPLAVYKKEIAANPVDPVWAEVGTEEAGD